MNITAFLQFIVKDYSGTKTYLFTCVFAFFVLTFLYITQRKPIKLDGPVWSYGLIVLLDGVFVRFFDGHAKEWAT